MARVHVSLTFVAALWGLVFIAVHEALRDFNSTQIVTIRFAIVCLLFGVLLLARRHTATPFSRHEWMLIVAGGFFAVPASQLAIIYAQNFLSPALAALLVTTSPAIAAVLAPLILKETITTRQAIGFAIALAGAILVILRGAGTGVTVESVSVLGAAVGLITPVAWALYTIISRILATAGHQPLHTVGVTLLVGSVFLIPFVPSTLGSVEGAAFSSVLWIAYMAVFGTFVAYLIWFAALRHLDAGRTSAYLYVVPIFALLWGYLLLRDVPPVGALLGGALIVAGVGLTQIGVKKAPTDVMEVEA